VCASKGTSLLSTCRFLEQDAKESKQQAHFQSDFCQYRKGFANIKLHEFWKQ
jgi:hypothetical protein